MIPVDQTITGPKGNCMSACIASLLHLPIERVARFIREPGDTHVFQWAERLDDFLEPFGLYALHFAADPERAAFPGVFHIMTGISPRGRPHAVIGKGCRIVHDPHPDKTGLVSIDGFCLLVPRWETQPVATTGRGPSDRVEDFYQRAESILSDIAEFTNLLDPRDALFVQIGLHASHMEEAIVAGDELRAKSHLRALVGLVEKVHARDGIIGEPSWMHDLRANASGGVPADPRSVEMFPGCGFITDWANLRAAPDGLVYDAGSKGMRPIGRLL